ncbi:MAG: PorV/PorQ family protein [Candidatus Eisenbacteria bacterium]|uniref:PorV/PorQ family protein n=1 Tax=Eiseniibacteriota bacterium TaxID=2212470 RepID=A0A849SPH5_UNCEI|nr:PorV/PorQ family protein [Candidatus Eisenbacteria bacterium]
MRHLLPDHRPLDPLRPWRVRIACAATAVALGVALGAVAWAPAVLAQAGPPGFTFLEVPTGARAAALGGAFATVAEGSDAAFWNPAGLAATQRFQLGGAHTEYLQQLRHEAFALAIPVGGGGIAGSVRALYSEPIAARDELGNEIGTFGAHDLEFGVAWGGRVSPTLRLGLGAQLVRERIDQSAAMTYAFSVGTAWDPARWPTLRFALAAQNLGPSPSFTIEDGEKGIPVPLPFAIQGGVRWLGPAIGTWQSASSLETRFTRGRSGLGMFGFELSQPLGAALRLGYRYNDDATNLSIGGGWATKALSLDYAFVPTRLELGDTHRLSFATRF